MAIVKESEQVPDIITSFTLYDPAAGKICWGLELVEVVPSPKFQRKFALAGVEILLNRTGLFMHVLEPLLNAAWVFRIITALLLTIVSAQPFTLRVISVIVNEPVVL